MYDSKILVERIKERAASQGIGIVQLHQMCGMSRNVVSQTANRKKGMTAENLCSIAEKLNCSADYLLGRTESPDLPSEIYIADGNSVQNVKNNTVNVNTSKEERKEIENVVDVIRYKKVSSSHSHTTCPFCSADVAETIGLTENTTAISFEDCKQVFPLFIDSPAYTVINDDNAKIRQGSVLLVMLRCPYCGEISSYAYDVERKRKINIYPNSKAKQFPNAVPEDIMKDYTEACDILELSPKASATLSRRCLQRMIREKWKIKGRNLNEEINEILKINITQLERNALHAIRKIGNIGAHPNEILEVTPEDAEMTIKAIEIFLQRWYVDEPKEKAELLTLTEMSSKEPEAKRESKEKDGEELLV